MVTKNEAFPSKYLKAEDLDGPTVATITTSSFEKLKSFDGKEQQKVVLYFGRGLKPMPLNLTNFDSVVDILGTDESNQWDGGKVELYPTQTTMGGKVVDCVRIRKPGAAAEKKTPKVTKLAAKPEKASVPLAEEMNDEISQPAAGRDSNTINARDSRCKARDLDHPHCICGRCRPSWLRIRCEPVPAGRKRYGVRLAGSRVDGEQVA